MVVPMVARGRSIGSLTLLSTREGRHYTTADLAFAETLAARCALAIDNARLHDAAERSLSLLDTVFATAPVGLAFVDPDLRFVRVNEAMAAFNGRAVQEHLGRTIPEVLGEPAAELAELYRRVLDTGRPLHDLQLSGATAAAPDDVRHFNVSCTPVHGPAGDLLGVSAVVLDVTDHQRSLEAERDARARADFLARAGGLLDESLDYERTLRAVADIAVPDIADWCAVSVLDELGALQQVAAAHVDPAQRELGEELPPVPGRPGSTTGTYGVARTGRTEVVRELTDEMLVAGLPDPEQLALVRRLGLRLGRRRRAPRPRPHVRDPDAGQRRRQPALRGGRRPAGRGARAPGGDRHRQRPALHGANPHRPHAAGQAPAGAPAGDPGRPAGGPLPGGRRAQRGRRRLLRRLPALAGEWAIVVGDVSGKGAEAAAVTALARYTLRAGRVRGRGPPSRRSAAVNGAMRTDDDAGQFATVALACVSHAAAAWGAAAVARRAPPALVVRRDGPVERAGTLGTMLALASRPADPRREHRLGPRRLAAPLHRWRHRGRPAVGSARRRRSAPRCSRPWPASRRTSSSTPSSRPSSTPRRATRATTRPADRAGVGVGRVAGQAVRERDQRAVSSSEACASSARISTVPRRGWGRSFHQNHV